MPVRAADWRLGLNCYAHQWEMPSETTGEASGKQRMTQRTKHCRPTGVHRRLQVINDRTYPSTLYSVGKPVFVDLPAIPVFVDLPAIFVILQPQKQLIDQQPNSRNRSGAHYPTGEATIRSSRAQPMWSVCR
jgi:hypothetical protein